MPQDRPLRPISIHEEERAQLSSWSRRPKTGQALALRARIVLLAGEGHSNTAIAGRLSTTLHTAAKWWQRFLEAGLDGLLDEPRPGTPRKLKDEQVEAVLTRTLERQLPAATHWSTREMAKARGLSQSTVSRIWRAFSLAPHRYVTFKLSKDPLFIEKVWDIVGLYLNPPERALVLCVDEKSQIQALDRTAPLFASIIDASQPTGTRRTHDYAQHGTASLFAALDTKTGELIGQDSASASLRGVPQLPRYDRKQRPIRVRGSSHPGQLWHPQDPSDSRLAGEKASLSSALHTHLGQLAQSRRTLVRSANSETAASWGTPFHQRTGRLLPALHRSL